MKRILLGAAALLSIGAMSSAAVAEYPERPVSMVIPYGPGGATDISARTIAAPLGKLVPKPVLMVNRTGAGGATGSVSVKNAKADGYTMLFARVGSHTVNPAMKATLPYTLADFRFVGVYEINPVVCAVNAKSDVKSMQDLADRVKAKPKTISYSSAGVGSLLHLAAAMVLREFGVDNPIKDAIHIPLKGGGAAATAVLSGTATFICTNSSALAPFVANKQLKPLIVTDLRVLRMRMVRADRGEAIKVPWLILQILEGRWALYPGRDMYDLECRLATLGRVLPTCSTALNVTMLWLRTLAKPLGLGSVMARVAAGELTPESESVQSP